ncbi:MULTISPECIES: TIGR03087 family PEP-CTERM/XrtA system glycosyltransferase [Kordiimonas]|jgi:sugar transferase (PEP-CTERM/EpsH1 system associated)|uniref:TIGR03087 family PEP-CTERM/XrtA system glycosyltransferase n=1 Tax=Kordiimonas TaxID=288021 RepID=UPI00257E1CE1|nr:TIGR03087 family PEP-CTERM/XrtA system glycosyltransferase [Kordiimonas sp. UBA4487]
MARILFLAHRIPYPPNKGDKIRSWHFLDHLLKNHEVHLGFYVDQPKDLTHIPFLQSKVKSLCYRCVSRFSQIAGILTGILRGRSMTLSAYPKNKLKAYVDDLFARDEIDLIFLFSAAVAPLVADRPAHIPVVADLVDVDSEKWAAYAQKSSWHLRWLYGREARLLLQFETAIADTAAATVFVSDAEAELFREKLGGDSKARVSHINNGVDLKAFDPSRFSALTVSPRTVIFTGAMDYQPNIEAAVWFVSHVWPIVRRTVPDAEFVIAGAPVHSRVRALADKPHVTVLGFVDDMAETIARAGLVVAPLLTARGIQNKVLEGMAMGKAVVATPAAKEGIDAEPGEHLIVADGAGDFAAAVVAQLQNPAAAAKLGQAARQHMVEHYSWPKSLKRLDALIDRVMPEETQ